MSMNQGRKGHDQKEGSKGKKENPYGLRKDGTVIFLIR